ncbi:MAG: DUF3179 domain-containing protein [Robiginitomaculum sp.]|nr:DUF3179 domain-containing protein [Robiginitomaculum sp.]
MKKLFYPLIMGMLFLVTSTAFAQSGWPNQWDWPDTDFTKHSGLSSEFSAGGPPKDGIPAIDNPQFKSASHVHYRPKEPVIALEVNGTVKAYPLSVLMWHEIANDVIAGVPVAVTFCPLCNAAIVYERTIDGVKTSFGVSGLLRNSDLVMYDRTTQSWWQQFTGRAIVGAHTGKTLTRLPAKIIPFSHFKARYPNADVLVPNDPKARRYGQNPYVSYDTTGEPFNVHVKMPKGFKRMERIVVVGDTAWRMTKIAKAGRIEENGLRLIWTHGQTSALGARTIGQGRDIGSVRVERQDTNGQWQLVNYDVTFAFVFAAFKPNGKWRG